MARSSRDPPRPPNLSLRSQTTTSQPVRLAFVTKSQKNKAELEGVEPPKQYSSTHLESNTQHHIQCARGPDMLSKEKTVGYHKTQQCCRLLENEDRMKMLQKRMIETEVGRAPFRRISTSFPPHLQQQVVPMLSLNLAKRERKTCFDQQKLVEAAALTTWVILMFFGTLHRSIARLIEVWHVS